MGSADRRGVAGDGALSSLLLDTHALLWWFTDPKALSQAALAALIDPRNTVLVSPVTIYELAYKNQIGKLEQANPLLDNLAVELGKRRFDRLDLTIEQALLGGRLAWPHKDPFDRLLVAQALVDDLTLVSNERLFDSTGVRRLW